MKKSIGGFFGLKAIALLLVVCFHAWGAGLPAVKVAMHMFFLTAGFAMAYQHFDDVSWRGARVAGLHLGRFLLRVYPEYLICTVLAVLTVPAGCAGVKMTIFDAVCHLLLLQPWCFGTRLVFTLNGPGWFVAALAFCYLLAPFAFAVMRRVRWAPLVGLSCLGLYAFFAALCHYDRAYFEMNMYLNPVARGLEFFFAASFYPVYRDLRGKTDACLGKWAAALAVTVAEVGLVALLCLFCLVRLSPVAEVVSIALSFALVLVLSLECGVVSRFLALRIWNVVSRYQLELYLFHGVVFAFMGRYLVGQECFQTNGQRILGIGLSFCAAVLYRHFLADRIGRAFKWGVGVLGGIFLNPSRSCG